VIAHADTEGGMLVRDVVVLTFYAQRPFRDLAKPVAHVFQSWLSIVPKESLRWTMIGSNADMSKAVTRTSVDRCLDQLDPVKAERRQITAFRIFGEEDENPRYRFYVVGNRDPRAAGPTFTSFVEMRFPSDFLRTFTIDRFVNFSRDCGQELPFDSGYAARALCRSDTGRVSKSGQIISGLALRHPGFDIPLNHAIRFRLGQQCRGAYWLTFLGTPILEKLGGADAFLANTDPQLSMTVLPGGVMVRAGNEPEVGDVNRRKALPHLEKLARLLEPVTLFGDPTLENEVFDSDEGKRERWERRFLEAVE
jgi:hypothetical protein